MNQRRSVALLGVWGTLVSLGCGPESVVRTEQRSSAGSAGTGGAPPDAGASGGKAGHPETADGFDCDRERCGPTEVCINCDFFGDAVPLMCAPNPELDREGYDARTMEAGCLAVYPFFECDGPEDCWANEHCVLGIDTEYPQGGCVAAPFVCDVPPDCVICRDDADCPSGSPCTQHSIPITGPRQICSG